MEVCFSCYGSGYARIECPECKGKGNHGQAWMSYPDDPPIECKTCFGARSIRVKGDNPPKRIRVAVVEHDSNIKIKRAEEKNAN